MCWRYEMNPEEVISRLEGLGVTVTTNGDRIRLDPASKVPAELIDVVRQQKSDLLRYLGRERNGNGKHQPASSTECPDVEGLLDWARDLARKDLRLEVPVAFIEGPDVPVWVEKVSAYAAGRLGTIASSRINQTTGGWKPWDAAWWKEREKEALEALKALKEALEVGND